MARILVVDDDKDIIDIIRFTLAQEQHDVIEARDGKEGLARATAEKPDLIILDIMMPEIDGLTVCAKLAVTPETKKIPVIILTAKGLMRDTFMGSRNVERFIDKPFDPSFLQDQIKTILNTRRNKPS